MMRVMTPGHQRAEYHRATMRTKQYPGNKRRPDSTFRPRTVRLLAQAGQIGRKPGETQEMGRTGLAAWASAGRRTNNFA